MGVTPARRLRDLERTDALREVGRTENENKFTEFRLGCDAGDVHACNALGEWFALMRQDFATAMEYYTPGCFKHRHAQSCLNYGVVAANGRGGVTKSIPNAIKAFTIGCEEGNADSCAEGGRILLSHAVKVSASTSDVTSATSHTALQANEAVTEAARLFRIGCEDAAGAPAAKCCGFLGAVLVTDGCPVKPDAKTQPLDLLKRACEGEHVHSCFKIAKLYRHGMAGTPKSLELADEFEKKGFAWAGMTSQQAAKITRVAGSTAMS